MKKIWITMVMVFATFHTCDLHAINSYSHTAFRTHHPKGLIKNIQLVIENHSNSDWEEGLREATIQALFKERIGDRNLQKRLHSAPLLSKRDLKSTFGDISLVAKGQLYVNYAGYTFVQDEDCDYTFKRCQVWQPQSNEQLLALWLVKKIRQHSRRLRHPTFDLEYTIIPVDLNYPNEYLTYEGNYNYDLPGHVFTLKNFNLGKNAPQTEILILQPTEARIYLPESVKKNYRLSTSSAELKMFDFPSTSNVKQVVYPTEMTTYSTSAPFSTSKKTETYKGISIINKQIVIANFYTLSPVNIFIPAPTAVTLMDQISHMTTVAKETMLYTKVTSTQKRKGDISTTPKQKTTATTTSRIRITSQKQKTEVYKDELTTLKQTSVTASKRPLSTPNYKPATTVMHQGSSTVTGRTSTTSKQQVSGKPGKPTPTQPVIVSSTKLSSSTTKKKIYPTSKSSKKQPSTTLKQSTIPTTKESTLTITQSLSSSLPPSDHQTVPIQGLNNSTNLGQTEPIEPLTTSLETTTVRIVTTAHPVLTTSSTVISQEPFTVHMPAFTTTVETTTVKPNQQTLSSTSDTEKYDSTVSQVTENSETDVSTKSTEAITSLSPIEIITEFNVKTTPEFTKESIKTTTTLISAATTRKPSTTTEESDFLVEDDNGGEAPISNDKPLKDYDDEDIFGPVLPQKQVSTNQEPSTKVYVPSDVEQFIFDSNRRSKALRAEVSTETTYLPPIMPTSTTSVKSTTEIKKRPVFSVSMKPITASGDTVPVTSQSYLTSISYEVNNRKNKSDVGLLGDDLITDESREIIPEGNSTDTGNRRVKTVKRFRYKRKKNYRRINLKAGNKSI